MLRGKLYTIVRDQPETANEGEKVVCADAATGEILWEHRFNVYLSDVPADTRSAGRAASAIRKRAASMPRACAATSAAWKATPARSFGTAACTKNSALISTYGGRTNMPVIFEDTVLISAVIVGWGDEPKWGGLARPAHRFMCFDKATGELRWLNGTGISPYDTTYSTPTVMPIGGQQALVFRLRRRRAFGPCSRGPASRSGTFRFARRASTSRRS